MKSQQNALKQSLNEFMEELWNPKNNPLQASQLLELQSLEKVLDGV